MDITFEKGVVRKVCEHNVASIGVTDCREKRPGDTNEHCFVTLEFRAADGTNLTVFLREDRLTQLAEIVDNLGIIKDLACGEAAE